MRRQIAKEWLGKNKNISGKDFIDILDSLYKGTSHEEKTIASYLIGYNHALRKIIKPKHLNKWLDHLVGWAEIDSLCQNVFTSEDILSDWSVWKSFIEKLAKDKNIHKRRASLVLLTGPANRSDDIHIRDLAFQIIEVLKHEKEIIITKAISWLLREMSSRHKKEVAEYLNANQDSLPKIAVRETKRKIETGRK